MHLLIARVHLSVENNPDQRFCRSLFIFFRLSQVSPFDKRDAADKKKLEFAVGNSDHLTMLKAYQVVLRKEIRTVCCHFVDLVCFEKQNTVTLSAPTDTSTKKTTCGVVSFGVILLSCHFRAG